MDSRHRDKLGNIKVGDKRKINQHIILSLYLSLSILPLSSLATQLTVGILKVQVWGSD
jgi:hypothetical protein